MRPTLSLISLLALTACFGDESLSAYGASGKVWVLNEIDGRPFSASATLEFPQPNRIAGTAPCNEYSASFDAPYPWFEIGPINATRVACTELDAEQKFFSALESMNISEVSGQTLVLSTDEGHEMVFTAAD
ncbi:MAG: META domain-containing protein [Paracoccaceae bacterium]